MRVVQVKCPKCGAAKTSKRREENLLFLCDSCGAIHTREPEVRVLDYQVAKVGRRLPGTAYYMPVWRMKTWVHIQNEQVAGGYVHKLVGLLSGPEPDRGFMDVFVPASDLDPATFRYWAGALTSNPPRYAPADDFGTVPRLPCVVTESEARELADFIILTNEAEKPGVLQDIDYSTRVDEVALLFLPFFWSEGQYSIAL